MNWSWNGGDPYMRGWGGVIALGLLAVMFSPVWTGIIRDRLKRKRDRP